MNSRDALLLGTFVRERHSYKPLGKKPLIGGFAVAPQRKSASFFARDVFSDLSFEISPPNEPREKAKLFRKWGNPLYPPRRRSFDPSEK